MSENKFQDHIYFLPEDDANKDILNGLIVKLSTNQIRVLNVAGGWSKAIEQFKSTHVQNLRRYTVRHFVLVIDIDKSETRIKDFLNEVPVDLSERVFILGTWSEPEELKAKLQCNYEKIGNQIAEECKNDSIDFWNHELLKHNMDELRRLNLVMKKIIF